MFNVLPSLPFTVLKIYIWVSYIYHFYGAIFHLTLNVTLQLTPSPTGNDRSDWWQKWPDLIKLSANLDILFLIHAESWACKWPTYLRSEVVSSGQCENQLWVWLKGLTFWPWQANVRSSVSIMSVRSDQENCHRPLHLQARLDMSEQAQTRDMSLLMAFKTFIILHWSYPFVAARLIYMLLITVLALTAFPRWTWC